LFAVGHLALGYLLGRASAKFSTKRVSVPLILALSIIPDADILLQPLFPNIHRGPTHSIVVLSIVFLPLFVIYRKEVIPYFVAIVSHPLIGDLLVGGSTKLLWPLSTQNFGFGILMSSPTNIVLEWSLFLLSIAVMLKIDDMRKLFQAHLSNLLLSIPVFTVLLPSILSIPLSVPIWLEPPHLVYMLLFAAAIIVTLVKLLNNGSQSKIACKQGDP
jgi:membrane-bound metal-dependent hydrolase YbcI (DUF457 family)